MTFGRTPPTLVSPLSRTVGFDLVMERPLHYYHQNLGNREEFGKSMGPIRLPRGFSISPVVLRHDTHDGAHSPPLHREPRKLAHSLDTQ
ncbi:unnamed protein product [Pieris macdunnoughi]|uniref:Uncharacterized protein n=1 Tax=Pieris macdunnoughi TaxID=345717 RepID=A0A821M2P6_9NEOP|nr:unnamed protein product [Pieris macdunnoughi]